VEAQFSAYKWPIYFFVAVAFWNFVGAGLFGFMINPPIALYYVQGLNLTPVHGHTALFGVYGMLGLGVMLFCLRALVRGCCGKIGLSPLPSGPSTLGWRRWSC
jgi:nitric oxide reductase subunit B